MGYLRKLADNGGYLRLIVFLILAAVYLAYPNARPDFTEFNAHDSESYVAISYNLLHKGEYTRSLDEDLHVPHTLWPPGMPLILMPAVATSGIPIDWFSVKATMIFWGMLGIVFSWLYIRSLSESRRIADFGALLVGLNPYYWHFSHVAMAELPIFVWAIASLYFSHAVLAKKEEVKLPKIFALGAFIGLGVLIKGVLLGLVFVPLGYFFRRSLLEPRALLQSSVFAIGFVIAFVGWGARNGQIDANNLGLDGVNQVQMMFKEVPEEPGSPYRDFGAIVTTAKENILWYGIYHLPSQAIPLVWAADLKNLPGSVIWGLSLSAVLLFGLYPRKRETIPLALLIASMVFMMMLITIGGSERYWFSISLLSFVLLVSQSKELLKKHFTPPSGRFVLCAGALCAISLGLYIIKHESEPFSSERNYASLAELYENHRGFCVENPVLQSKNFYAENVHAFTLITGCKASMSIPAAEILPLYTHAIVNRNWTKRKLDPSLTVIGKQGPWAIVELPREMNGLEISMVFYSK